MHSMTGSATSREVKRLRTERRICICAQQLTEERGLDGFTMDDLAARAEVSRRTLFNYFPGKLDAVLGPRPLLSEEACTRFVSGGPTGHLIDDLSALADEILDVEDVDLADLSRAKRVVMAEPRLVAMAHERFESVLGELVDLILEREGDRITRTAARVLIRVLVAVFECAMADAIGGDDRTLDELFDSHLATARTLLA
jgi:AcrR family transcriptional regulator